MPRDLSVDLLAHFQGEVLTLAMLVRVTRRDGLVVGMTSAQSAITYDSTTFEPQVGLASSAIEQSAGTGIDSIDVDGFLTSDVITEIDLEAGLWDGAAVELLLVNRSNLAQGHVMLMKGSLGQVTIDDHGFRSEVLGLSNLLKQNIAQRTSPTCRCRRLGDSQCKISMVGNAVNGHAIRQTVTVSSVASDLQFVANSSAPTGHFASGIVRCEDGANAGLEREVKSHTKVGSTAEIELHIPFPFVIEVGDEVRLEAGCDRSLARCRDYFDNANNFHGEPFLPGNDKITQAGRAPTS